MISYRRFLLLQVILSTSVLVIGQTSFESGGGCLNVIDVSFSQSIGEYGDRCISANYLHERFINEDFSIGAGVGYNYHYKYNFSAIPIYFSTHYFFLDKQFSPFVNMRVGGYVMFNQKNVGTNKRYSLSDTMQGFSLFLSPSVGVKMHISKNVGIMISISDEAYLVNSFDVKRGDYKNKLIHDFGISIGVCFQIKGW